MYSVVLVRRQCTGYAVGVKVLVSLQAGCRGLDPGARAALAAKCLVSHGALVHGRVVAVPQLWRGVSSKSGYQGS